jgi:hypothetical protein
MTRSSGTLAPDVTPDRSVRAGQPGVVDLGGVVDQVRRGRPGVAGHLHQPYGIGGIGGTDHDHDVARRRDLLDHVLPVLGGVADVVAGRRLQQRQSGLEALDGLHCLVHRQRGLGQPHHLGRVTDLHPVDTVRPVHELDVRRRLADVPTTSSWPSCPMSRMS